MFGMLSLLLYSRPTGLFGQVLLALYPRLGYNVLVNHCFLAASLGACSVYSHSPGWAV